MNIDEVLKKFDEYCKTRTNLIMERHRFLNRRQIAGETADEFLINLKKLAVSCKYQDIEEDIIRDQLILNLYDSHQQSKLLDKI